MNKPTKIFRSKNGMDAVVDTETGRAIWLDTGRKIWSKVDVNDGTWTEQTLVPVVGEGESIEVWAGGIVHHIHEPIADLRTL